MTTNARTPYKSHMLRSLFPALCVGLVVTFQLSTAHAGIDEEVRATYADSLDAIEEVDEIITANVANFDKLNATAIDLHQRRLDAVQLRERVLACGRACEPHLGVIELSVANLNDSSESLKDFASPMDWILDWCCEYIDNDGNAYGCVHPGGYMTTCLGICWSCNQGWSNEDGSFGCDGGTTQDCPL